MGEAMKWGLPRKIIAIDFETANSNNFSACSLGLCVISGFEIAERQYYLIQPPGNIFDEHNSRIHGICADDTREALTFLDLWPQIREYFCGEHYIVAHNAQFDMSVLWCCLDYYDIPKPDFEYLDTLNLCSLLPLFGEKRNLGNVAKCLGLPNEEHHNALNDALLCAQVALASFSALLSSELDQRSKLFGKLKVNQSFGHTSSRKRSRTYAPIDISSLTPSGITGHAVSGKIVVITGEFNGFSRQELAERLASLGAIVKASVVLNTSFLFVGSYEQVDFISTKERKALELIGQGRNITIVRECELEAFLS